MGFAADKTDRAVAQLDERLAGAMGRVREPVRAAAERWRGDAGALRYHLSPGGGGVLIAILGGTGTGKSTLLNRLLGKTVSATSFRRTFTAGAVAVAGDVRAVPPRWLGVEHADASGAELPARGRAGALTLVALEDDLLNGRVLIDTPDLDGDQPAHHAEADRVFRWADAVLFLVTPEKYQMTELMPYYRLAVRYELPALFTMNKCEQEAVADDYARLLANQDPAPQVKVFVIPRDDAGYAPPAERDLQALRQSIAGLSRRGPAEGAVGVRRRAEDLLGRFDDQVLGPLRHDRASVDRLVAQVRGMESPAPGVDVNPVTFQLQRRMQQRSVLYLMGPQRVLDRVRQAPGLLVRLPRVAWDYVMRGEISPAALSPASDRPPEQVPDFRALLTDQFNVLQSRLDDALRGSDLFRGAAAEPAPYRSAFVDPAEAGRIAEEELNALRTWLEQRWNATPRDTRLLETLLKHLPGGKQITRWTEAAPYLLVVAVAAATHHLFGGVDLIVLGGWSVATWLTERLSNEVAAHTRMANQRITERFERLAHHQIEDVCRWLEEQVPSSDELKELEDRLERARATLDA